MNVLIGLNSLLDNFYLSHVQIDTIERWLVLHTFDKALPDYVEAA